MRIKPNRLVKLVRNEPANNSLNTQTRILASLLGLATGIFCAGCAGLNGSEPTAKVDNSPAQEMGPYSGPKASVAMAKFEWKSGGEQGRSVRIDGPNGVYNFSVTQQNGYMQGLGDMLTTALVESGRFRVLERQDFDATTRREVGLSDEGWTSKETKKEKGRVKGADLQVVAAITGWEPNASGRNIKGLGAGLLPNVPLIGGAGINLSRKRAKAAMDIRIIDTETSEILTAKRIEGEATDSSIGLAGVGIGRGGLLAGAFSEYKNTPMEAAIRVMINKATTYVALNTPPSYFRHSTQPAQQAQPVQPVTPSVQTAGSTPEPKGTQP